ncbi:hypothetical protein ACROYT_G023576 [Oculina patagonica]
MPARPGSTSTELDPDEEQAVVISLSRDHDQECSSFVFCLKIVRDFQNDESAGVMGNPFRLEGSSYIWPNDELKDNNIEVGSIISYRLQKPFQKPRYLGNTGNKLDTSKVFSCLYLANQSSLFGGVVYHGIKDAFPNSVIAKSKDVYQTETRPSPPYVLLNISQALIEDDRINITTGLGEELNLRNRSVIHTTNLIQPVKPLSKEDVGDVVLLVGFGSHKTGSGRYQAVCEGILFNPVESTQVHSQGILPGNPGFPSYKMNSFPHGKCIIINNESFHNKAVNPDRDGAKHDEKGLKDLFEELGFVVDIRRNLTQSEINETTREVAGEDHRNCDAFVFIIMSHGEACDVVLGVDGRPVYVKDIMTEFKAIKRSTLRGKPKLFFMQCCRGLLPEFLSPPNTDSFEPSLNCDSTLASGVCPQEADFLLAFASAPGYVSYRRPESGSVFIQVSI